jgi:hypothetical protein
MATIFLVIGVGASLLVPRPARAAPPVQPATAEA